MHPTPPASGGDSKRARPGPRQWLRRAVTRVCEPPAIRAIVKSCASGCGLAAVLPCRPPVAWGPLVRGWAPGAWNPLQRQSESSDHPSASYGTTRASTSVGLADGPLAAVVSAVREAAMAFTEVRMFEVSEVSRLPRGVAATVQETRS